MQNSEQNNNVPQARMRILSVLLKGYKPLALSNIHSLYIDMLSDITLILGTNGCGKTSVLRELTPLPATKDDYWDDGEKHVYIQYNNSEYVLISKMQKGGKHTFIKDGVELSSNGTATTQRELVLNEFGYTPLIHRLLIGEIQFTKMKPPERRDILTAISPLDLTYAINLHAATKSHLRDTTGVLKHLNAKKTDVEHRLLELKIADNAIEANKMLEEHLVAVTPFTYGEIPGVQELLQRIEHHYNRLKQLKTRVDQIDKTRVPVAGITSCEDLNRYMGMCANEIKNARIRIESLSVELDDLCGLRNSMSDETVSATDVMARVTIIESELSGYTEPCYVSNNHEQYLSNLNELASALDILFDKLGDTPQRPEQEIADIKSSYNEILLQRQQITKQISDTEKDIVHYNDTNAVNKCPKCLIMFDRDGTDVNEALSNANKRLNELRVSFQVVDAKVESMLPWLNEIYVYTSVVNEVLVLRRNLYLPVEFWGEDTPATILANRTNIGNRILLWQHNIQNGLLVKSLTTELLGCKHALAVLNQFGGSVFNKINQLERELSDEINKRCVAQNNLTIAEKAFKNIESYGTAIRLVDEEQTQLLEDFKLLVNSVIQENAKSIRSELFTELSINSQALKRKEALEHSLVELDDEILTVTERNKALSILEAQLSPSKGVIAEQMMAFITSYISEMNLITADIFTYDLIVQPCDMTDGNLDYTFPLKADTLLVPDIFKASKGQAVAIDLAFMIIMRQYLGLTHYPMYLDETGEGFDETHLVSLINYIKKIAHGNYCSQLFIINHYTNVHGSLSNHDTVVLDARNITVPAEYNTHVIIETK